MRARKSALSSQSGNLLFMFAMGFNLLWSCWGFVVMVSNRESDRKGKRMTEKQRIEKNCWRKSTHVCYLRVLWRCLLLPGNETDVWSLSLHVVDIFSMMCFFYFLTKTISFFCFIVCLRWVLYIKLENMAYAFATNQNSTFKIQAELNWFRFVCVIWCVAKQNDGFEW